MNIFDYSEQGRRPSAKRIVSDWKKVGQPGIFQVEYGETFAEFEQYQAPTYCGVSTTKWVASGNGCRGVDRDAVIRLLQSSTACSVLKKESKS